MKIPFVILKRARYESMEQRAQENSKKLSDLTVLHEKLQSQYKQLDAANKRIWSENVRLLNSIPTAKSKN